MEVFNRKQPLVRQIVDGKNRCNTLHRVAGNVGAGHGRVPVMGVQDVWHPERIQFARRQMCSRPPEQGKALDVVRPLATLTVLIRISRALVQIGRIDDVGQDTIVRHAPQAQCDPTGSK